MSASGKGFADVLRDWAYKTIVVKIGGARADDPAFLAALKKDFATLRTSKTRIALVHGASKQIKAQFPNPEYVDGMRVTSPQMIEALPGIHEAIANQIENAISDETYDTRVFPHPFYATPRKTPLQAVGEIYEANTAGIYEYFVRNGDPGARAICSPLALNKAGGRPEFLNVNADHAAAHLAVALKADALIFLAETNGVLDVDDKTIPRICRDTDQNTFKDGMAIKVSSAWGAAHSVNCVRITPADCPNPVLNALSEDFKGTGIVVESVRIE